MAVSAIVRVLSRLISKHGFTKGIKKAQKLGFRNKDIKNAVSQAGAKKAPYKRGGTFQQRKGMRDMGRDVEAMRRAELYELGGYQVGGVQGDISRAAIMRKLLQGGKVSPKMSRGRIRDVPYDYRRINDPSFEGM
jgi:hypothetical protein